MRTRATTARKTWMARLAEHYEKTRSRYPDDKLMIIFDIDGTILDMRYMVLHVLQAFDRSHGTDFFAQMTVDDITVHENQVGRLLAEMDLPPETQKEVLDWYNRQRWSPVAIRESHRPFFGVLEVIRWFQMQPNTYVGLNTGRPEAIRDDTLHCLNKLGREHRVHFDSELLYMNPGGWGENVSNSKVEGVLHFRRKGFRIFAIIDNEPDNLRAISQIDPDQEILLLHANTIFESKRTRLPRRVARGRDYDLTELIPEKALPRNIQLVWHGVNDEVNLRQFLASDIQWAECDVRMDPMRRNLILRHDPFNEVPIQENEEWFYLDYLLRRLKEMGRGVKLDLKEGGELIEMALEAVKRHGFDDKHLWFNGNVEQLQESGFRRIASEHPDAILQCPVDFLAPLIRTAPEKAKEILDMFASWGINRFSINWQVSGMRQFFNQMDEWGFEVNIYNDPDLESFLQAVLLMPRSITSDFNFPKWHYFGMGSGQGGKRYEYEIRE